MSRARSVTSLSTVAARGGQDGGACGFNDAEALEERLSRPTAGVVEAVRRLDGDWVVLGVAGKMGPTLARMAKRASDEAGGKRRVFGVSRFSDSAARQRLEDAGVETLRGDLLDEAFVAGLPDAANVVYMAGMKFGTRGNESLTWAMNTLLPAAVCRRYRGGRIAAFSTGNVYGLTPVTSGGSRETDPPNPAGEYAMSCLGRERVFEHYARTDGTAVSILRLNYACETRYGVLVDLAQKVLGGKPVDLSMGMANVIWQGDANAAALRSIEFAASPLFVLNLAGPEQASIRRLCGDLGRRLGVEPVFEGEPGGDALLSDGGKQHALFGYPEVPLATLLDWVAHWVGRGGETLGKPTKFEVRDGGF